MRKFVLAAVGGLVFSGPAIAADLAVKALPPVATAYDWSGVYIGAHVGAGAQSVGFQDPSASTNLVICCNFVGGLGQGAAAPSANGSSFLGGAQAGWNYQVGRLVVGGDYDFSWTRLKGNTVGTIPGITPGSPFGASESFKVSTDWTATLTSTLGWAVDRWLVYGKAGAAFAHDSYALGMTGYGVPGFASTANEIRAGWTVGAGVAWAIDHNWSVKLEYDYLNFPTRAVDFTGASPAATFNTNSSQAISEIKLGANYKLAPGLIFGQPGGAPGLFGVATAPAVDWTGFYVGGHVGGGWQSTAFQDPSAVAAVTVCCDQILFLEPSAVAPGASAGGFLGGVQAGVNYQIKRLVLGAELDWSGTGLKTSNVGTIPGLRGIGNTTETFGARTSWTTTATASIGLAYDRWLIYGKTGVAFAQDSYDLAVDGTNGSFFGGGYSGTPFAFASSASGVRTGWTVGTGVAYAISNNWSVKAEYDYLGFPTRAVDFTGVVQNATGGPPGVSLTGPSTFNTNNSQHISEAKLGLNYKFAPNLLLDAPEGAAGGYYKAAPRVAAVDWTGFYVGGHVGGGWQTTSFQDPSATTAIVLCCELLASLAPGASAADAAGGAFLGGVQAGWNYQIKRLVVGAEVDWSGTRLNSSNVVNFANGGFTPTASATETFGMRTDWTATATAAAGLTFDRLLVYGKGGLAFAHDSETLTMTGNNVFFAPPSTFSFASSSSETRIGWTVGAGVAWSYTSNWSLKAEYDYMDFATKAADFTGVFQNSSQGMTSAATLNTNNSLRISELKLGVNYRFAPGTSF